MCGTPNYMASEVLFKEGHSYEIDIWALGCILYALLSGRPPFETKEEAQTKARIKQGKYVIPAELEKSCPSAVELIKWTLQRKPARRPTIKQILESNFLTGYFLLMMFAHICLENLIHEVSKSEIFGFLHAFCSLWLLGRLLQKSLLL